MTINRIETLAYITGDIEVPFDDYRGIKNILLNIFTMYDHAQHTRILIAGSGKGSDVLAVHELVPNDTPIVALDCNVPIDRTVLTYLGRRSIIQNPNLLHVYLLQNFDPFSTIILSTGGSHGITEEEFKALRRSLTDNGLIVCSWDSDLNDDLASAHIGVKQETNLPYYTAVWQKRQ